LKQIIWVLLTGISILITPAFAQDSPPSETKGGTIEVSSFEELYKAMSEGASLDLNDPTNRKIFELYLVERFITRRGVLSLDYAMSEIRGHVSSESTVQKGIDSYQLSAENSLWVRPLSTWEKPFRGALGNDCSTDTYPAKALDPNFWVFTITNEKGESTGHITIVLGEAQNEKGENVKVAMVDKIQSVPVAYLEDMLEIVRRNAKSLGYELGIPLNLGNHADGTTNLATIRDHLKNKYAPYRDSQVQVKTFMGHDLKPNEDTGASRAYDKLTLAIIMPLEGKNYQSKGNALNKKIAIVGNLNVDERMSTFPENTEGKIDRVAKLSSYGLMNYVNNDQIDVADWVRNFSEFPKATQRQIVEMLLYINGQVDANGNKIGLGYLYQSLVSKGDIKKVQDLASMIQNVIQDPNINTISSLYVTSDVKLMIDQFINNDPNYKRSIKTVFSGYATLPISAELFSIMNVQYVRNRINELNSISDRKRAINEWNQMIVSKGGSEILFLGENDKADFNIFKSTKIYLDIVMGENADFDYRLEVFENKFDKIFYTEIFKQKIALLTEEVGVVERYFSRYLNEKKLDYIDSNIQKYPDRIIRFLMRNKSDVVLIERYGIFNENVLKARVPYLEVGGSVILSEYVFHRWISLSGMNEFMVRLIESYYGNAGRAYKDQNVLEKISTSEIEFLERLSKIKSEALFESLERFTDSDQAIERREFSEYLKINYEASKHKVYDSIAIEKFVRDIENNPAQKPVFDRLRMAMGIDPKIPLHIQLQDPKILEFYQKSILAHETGNPIEGVDQPGVVTEKKKAAIRLLWRSMLDNFRNGASSDPELKQIFNESTSAEVKIYGTDPEYVRITTGEYKDPYFDRFFNESESEKRVGIAEQMIKDYLRIESFIAAHRDKYFGKPFFKAARQDYSEITGFLKRMLGYKESASFDLEKFSSQNIETFSQTSSAIEWQRRIDMLEALIRTLQAKRSNSAEIEMSYRAAIDVQKRLIAEYNGKTTDAREREFIGKPKLSLNQNRIDGVDKEEKVQQDKMSFARLETEAKITHDQIRELYLHHKGKPGASTVSIFELNRGYETKLFDVTKISNFQALHDFYIQSFEDILAHDRAFINQVLQTSRDWKLSDAQIQVLRSKPTMYQEYFSNGMMKYDPKQFLRVSSMMNLKDSDTILKHVKDRMNKFIAEKMYMEVIKDPQALDYVILLSDERNMDEVLKEYFKHPEVLQKSEILKKVMVKIKAGKVPTSTEIDEVVKFGEYRKSARVRVILAAVKDIDRVQKKNLLIAILSIEAKYPILEISLIEEYFLKFHQEKVDVTEKDLRSISSIYARSYFDGLEQHQKKAVSDAIALIKEKHPEIEDKDFERIKESWFRAHLTGASEQKGKEWVPDAAKVAGLKKSRTELVKNFKIDAAVASEVTSMLSDPNVMVLGRKKKPVESTGSILPPNPAYATGSPNDYGVILRNSPQSLDWATVDKALDEIIRNKPTVEITDLNSALKLTLLMGPTETVHKIFEAARVLQLSFDAEQLNRAFKTLAMLSYPNANSAEVRIEHAKILLNYAQEKKISIEKETLESTIRNAKESGNGDPKFVEFCEKQIQESGTGAGRLFSGLPIPEGKGNSRPLFGDNSVVSRWLRNILVSGPKSTEPVTTDNENSSSRPYANNPQPESATAAQASKPGTKGADGGYVYHIPEIDSLKKLSVTQLIELIDSVPSNHIIMEGKRYQNAILELDIRLKAMRLERGIKNNPTYWDTINKLNEIAMRNIGKKGWDHSQSKFQKWSLEGGKFAIALIVSEALRIIFDPKADIEDMWILIQHMPKEGLKLVTFSGSAGFASNLTDKMIDLIYKKVGPRLESQAMQQVSEIAGRKAFVSRSMVRSLVKNQIGFIVGMTVNKILWEDGLKDPEFLKNTMISFASFGGAQVAVKSTKSGARIIISAAKKGTRGLRVMALEAGPAGWFVAGAELGVEMAISAMVIEPWMRGKEFQSEHEKRIREFSKMLSDEIVGLRGKSVPELCKATAMQTEESIECIANLLNQSINEYIQFETFKRLNELKSDAMEDQNRTVRQLNVLTPTLNVESYVMDSNQKPELAQRYRAYKEGQIRLEKKYRNFLEARSSGYQDVFNDLQPDTLQAVYTAEALLKEKANHGKECVKKENIYELMRCLAVAEKSGDVFDSEISRTYYQNADLNFDQSWYKRMFSSTYKGTFLGLEMSGKLNLNEVIQACRGKGRSIIATTRAQSEHVKNPEQLAGISNAVKKYLLGQVQMMIQVVREVKNSAEGLEIKQFDANLRKPLVVDVSVGEDTLPMSYMYPSNKGDESSKLDDYVDEMIGSKTKEISVWLPKTTKEPTAEFMDAKTSLALATYLVDNTWKLMDQEDFHHRYGRDLDQAQQEINNMQNGLDRPQFYGHKPDIRVLREFREKEHFKETKVQRDQFLQQKARLITELSAEIQKGNYFSVVSENRLNHQGTKLIKTNFDDYCYEVQFYREAYSSDANNQLVYDSQLMISQKPIMYHRSTLYMSCDKDKALRSQVLGASNTVH